MRARAIAAAGVLLGSSCVQVVSETRRERGPLLHTFERQGPKEPAGLRAEARARWPSLELTVTSSSVCRTESVREYAEEVVTERSSPTAGPSIALGVTAAAVGGALLLFRGSFSAEPNDHLIDAAGRYGASDRQVATGWAIPLLVIGVSSIATGVVGLMQSGETTSQRAVDQVLDVHEARCDERTANGKLAIVGPSGPLEGRATQDGKVSLSPEALKGSVVGLSLDGEPVALDADDQEELESFRACARALPFPDDAALKNASTPALILRLEEAQRCARIQGAGGAEAATRLTGALAARAPPSYATLEEAAAALSPSLALAPGSADVEKLWRGATLEGFAARVSGAVIRRAGPNLVLLDIGAQDLFLETDQAWPEPGPRPGQKLEAVGVLVGRRTVGEVEAPILRAVFVRVAR